MPRPAFRIKEFHSMDEYLQWLSRMGEQIKVIHMVTKRERWSVRDGTVRNSNTPTYIITYKQVQPSVPQGDGKQCFSCGAANPPDDKFCGACGAPLFKPASPAEDVEG